MEKMKTPLNHERGLSLLPTLAVAPAIASGAGTLRTTARVPFQLCFHKT